MSADGNEQVGAQGGEHKGTKAEHEPPAGAERQLAWTAPGGEEMPYTARAGWMLLREKDKPVAEVFSVAYLQGSDEARPAPTGRPVTFVFNGGPGASSAYLHVGALGPRRVAFQPDGTLLPPPARLVANEQSWLAFSDLVFIDPVGTGFSRLIDDGDAKSGDGKGGDTPDERRFFGVKRDLESLGEFIRRWLSANNRWGSAVFIAGESYGGFRAAKLARLLPETYGIGLTGAILISPALEWAGLEFSDYDVLPWLDRVPTMAAAAAFHGKARPAATPEEARTAGEEFATGEYTAFLTRGASLSDEQRRAAVARLAATIGLDEDFVARAEGRVGLQQFTRELLRADGRVAGLYDATITIRDPFPNRDSFEGPDPTLRGIEAVFAAGINQQLREEIGVDTEREYLLLSFEVNQAWKVDIERHAFELQVGATDDFRYGMSLSPHLRAFITHGRYDLVTPYYTSDRLRNLMRLGEEGERLTVRHFDGGHMFYTWDDSRQAFTAAIADFVDAALTPA